jgi:hypothetical protein
MNRGRALMVACIAGYTATAWAGPDPIGSGAQSRPHASRPGSGGGAPEAFPFSENFESYAVAPFPCVGGGCAGPNGWSVWYTGGPEGDISTERAHSGTKSLRLRALSDIVQTGELTSGQWIARAWTYFPSNATGVPRQAYFIILNTYNNPAVGADSWSIQVQFNGDTNTVNLDFNAGSAPLILDQWVEIRAEIDLSTDTFDLFYNNAPVATDQAYSTHHGPIGRVVINAMDLYSNGVDGFFYDDVEIVAASSGCYPNCDNSTTSPILNVQDFTCFLQRYAAGDTYANCDNSTQAPTLNVQDFTCFLQSYAAGCP